MDSKLSRWCDGLLEIGWLTAIIATPLFFNIHSDRVFEPDKLTLLRSIAVVMIVAWLIKFIDQQRWNDLSWLRWRDPHSIWRMPLVLPTFLLVVVYLISTLISVTPRVSWAGSYQRLQGTYTTLSYITIFFLAIATMRTRTQIARVVTAVIVTSIPVSFYGMLQRFELDPLPWGGNTVTRIAGHMGNSIFVAAYLIMAVPLTLSRIVDAFTSILNDEDLAYADVVRSSIYIFTLAIQIIAIYWTQSRGPWIGIAVGLFTFVLILLVSLRNAEASSGRFRIMEAIKALLLVAVGTAVFYFFLSFLIGAITDSGRLASLAGPMTSFVSFAGAVGMLVLGVFVMIAARRGWRWLWLAWMLLSFVVAIWLIAFNFSSDLEEQFADTPVLGDVSATISSWRELPSIGRLGRLLESESGTGRVRVLIWQGALDLIEPHEPLEFPDGSDDSFNFLRVLFGYGPESMYVAYNRFYPPELATVEARNASPDRSHNETFDALVITGAVGFVVWQILYLSIFYYAFRWLGVVRSKLDRNLLIGLWIGGAIIFSIIFVQAMSIEFLGAAIPFGSIAGLIVYLLYYALFARSDGLEEGGNRDPFQIDRLLMIGLVTAVLAHYLEIHFGIAIAATRIHFFMYAGLIFMLGYRLQSLKEDATVVAEVRSRGRKNKRRALKDHELTGKWGPVLLYGLLLALMIGILGYEFTTYSLPPDKVITAPGDLTTSEIFQQSFLINASDGFQQSPFVFLLILMTWGLGSLVMISELVKSGELNFTTAVAKPTPANKVQLAAGLFGLMAIIGIVVRFFLPAAEPLTTTSMLGQSILLIWAALCLWAAVRLFIQKQAAHTFSGLMALVGFLASIPALIAGGGWVALITAVLSGAVLYLLWDVSWQKAIVPAGVLGAVSIGVGLLYAFAHASALRSTLFAPNVEVQDIVELRVLEAVRSTSFLTLFYVFVILLMAVGAYFIAAHSMSKLRDTGSGPGFASLLILSIIGLAIVSQTNLRVIQADIVYKRGKPFDSQASSSSDPQIWDIAIGIYEKALDMTPNEDFYYLFLGRAYLERSTITQDVVEREALLEEAERRLLKAQEVNPLNTDHTANLARLNTRWTQLTADPIESEAKLTRAEGFYQAALALSPQNSVIRNEYARLAYDLQGNCDKAIDIYTESVTIDPYYEASFFGLTDVYIACAADQEELTDYYSNAADTLEAGLGVEPRNARGWYQLGQLRNELEQYEAAVAAYEEAKVRDTSNQLPAWNVDYIIATTYQQMGETDLALAAAQQALGTAPGEALSQVQALISELSGEPLPEPLLPDPVSETPGTGELLAGERPLAALEPSARNGYFSQYPEFVIDPTKTYDALLTTEKGEIRIRLFADRAPLTVNNFVFLANQGFYDSTTFHRVLEAFMAQAGDPTGTGSGGPGYQFGDETDNGLSFDRAGLLAMANAGPGTNGSQFFITFEPTPWLDGNHTIFGEVVSGVEVLNLLTRRDPNQSPAFVGDRIERIDIVEFTQ